MSGVLSLRPGSSGTRVGDPDRGGLPKAPSPTDAPELLALRDIARSFGGPDKPVVVFDGIDLAVRRGEFVSLVGPSGCGKTTLLLCLAGLLPLSRGEIAFKGRRIDAPPPGLAVVFQDYGRSLFPWKRNLDNVLFGMRRLTGLSRARKRETAAELLSGVGLAGFENHYPWQVSGGMQQRVAIARALASRSDLLLLDEPFAALDALTRAGMHELMLAICKTYDQTCILVTHDIEEALFLGTRVCVLSSRPSRIILDQAVDIPHPRDQLATREHPRFLALRHEVLELIKRRAVAPSSPRP